MSGVAATAGQSLRPEGVSLARALGSSTRSSIYSYLQEADAALTVRDIAAAFDLHPNVARTHLETLAEAGLVEVGRRKHPGGGRPAKLYQAQTAPAGGVIETTLPTGSSRPGTELCVRLLAGLLDGERPGPGGAQPASRGDGARARQPAHEGAAVRDREESLTSRAHDAAATEGRRLVGTHASSRSAGSLKEAAEAALEALTAYAPQARIVKTGEDWVDVAGVRGAFALLATSHGELADALERGLLAGALAGAGAPAALSEAGSLPGGGVVLRARPSAPAGRRSGADPAECVDTRGSQRETGVVKAMRAITDLHPGEVLEVLTEGPGSPAAFARWADRAGHQLLGVERATDARDRPAIRLLIRKGADVRPAVSGSAGER